MATHVFDCKCGIKQGYDTIDTFDPHPEEEESPVVRKFYERGPSGVYMCVGIEVSGAEGGRLCCNCTNKHELTRLERRERRLEDKRKRMQPKAYRKEEEKYGKGNRL